MYIFLVQLNEPVVQQQIMRLIWIKRFDGVIRPLMGAVFMDADNRRTLVIDLTWLFGHARGSKVPDHRMFKM